jgi:hypothetical protein
MFETINCTYKTPCGWCTKWDKKCTKQLHGRFGEILDELEYITLSSLRNQIKQIKITTSFDIYLCSRYEVMPLRAHVAKAEFMGIPVVVDDNIDSEFYEIVLKENEYDT